MNNTTIPTAAELRKQLKVAKEQNFEPVRLEAQGIVEQFSGYIASILKSKNGSATTLFSTELPIIAYEDANEKVFFDHLKSLLPSDYRVEKSHDGGMYSTVVIRWDEVKPTVTRTTRLPRTHGFCGR